MTRPSSDVLAKKWFQKADDDLVDACRERLTGEQLEELSQLEFEEALGRGGIPPTPPFRGALALAGGFFRRA